MNDANLPLQTAVHQLLARTPELTAAQLQVATGKSQPSISLALKALGLGQPNGAVHRLGAARSSRYALTQSIQGLPARHALLCDGPDGVPQHFGELTYLSGDRVQVVDGAGKLQWRQVKVGLNNKVDAQILSGLEAGESVVVSQLAAQSQQSGRMGPPMGM